MKIWSKRPLAAVLLGALLTLSFAPFGIYPLAVIAPAGLLVLWLQATPKSAFWLGFLFGVGLFSSGAYWLYTAIHDFGYVDHYLTIIIMAGFVSILSTYPALVGYLCARFFPLTQPTNLLCAFPALWISAEWLRGWLFSGFPWLFLGYSQTNSPLKGYAPILSVYGVSLAIAFTSALFVNAWRKYQQKDYRALYISLFVIAAIWISGALLNLISWTTPTSKPISVSLIQGNIPQSIKWSPEHLDLSLNRYTSMTKPLLKKNQLIIWPEAAVPISLQNASDFIDALDSKANAAGSSIILGIPAKALEGDGYYNAIVTLGKTRNIYLKRRLVPFGEYTPFQHYVARFFDFMNVPMSTMVSGNYQQPPLMIDNVKILPSICFEITVPELMRSNDSSIGALLTLTNDAWFGNSTEQALHLQMAQMRALEFKRPLIFSSNDGISAFIGADGRIESTAPAHTVAILNGNIQPRNGLTPWLYLGGDPMTAIVLFLLFRAIRTEIRRRYSSKTNTSNEGLITI